MQEIMTLSKGQGTSEHFVENPFWAIILLLVIGLCWNFVGVYNIVMTFVKIIAHLKVNAQINFFVVVEGAGQMRG